MRRLKAFTLLEVLVVLGILSAISVIIIPVAVSQLRRDQAESTATDITSAMFAQQQKAVTGQASSGYGIAIYSNKYTIYKGASLAAATVKDDVTFTSGLSISNINLAAGGNEIKFNQGSVTPNTTGSFNINSSNSTYKVDINREGLISTTRQ